MLRESSCSSHSNVCVFGCLLFAASFLPALAENSVTVVLDFDEPHSPASVAEMEREATYDLKKTGYSFDWRLYETLQPQSEFKDLLILKMKGRCSLDTVPMLIDERGPLGMTFVSDGYVLSFGQIECNRIRNAVLRASPRWDRPGEEKLLGRALGRVVAHEMYHMLARSTLHTKRGLTKPGLTADELTDNHAEPLDSITKR